MSRQQYKGQRSWNILTNPPLVDLMASKQAIIIQLGSQTWRFRSSLYRWKHRVACTGGMTFNITGHHWALYLGIGTRTLVRV